jgi:lysophospholipase L1-like esterase
MPSNSIRSTRFLALAIACVGFAGPTCLAQVPAGTLRFDLGPGPVAPGYLKVRPSTFYSQLYSKQEGGFGFEPGSKVEGVDRGGNDPLRDDFCTADKPFSFSVAVPEGNYEVRLILGDSKGESTTTVKAESRRLMLERVHTAPGSYASPTFTVNVRRPSIASGGAVKLKSREAGVLHWDEKLTLEFNDAHPCVCGIEIKKVDDAVTVYLAGDSTVTDQPREPWNSWGQMLPRFFKAGVAVANHAESGETLRSFVGARRLDKILSTIKPGDYLFVQFGHNDQKERGEGVGAFTTYKESLKRFVAEARKRQALPVLVTPVSRRVFDPIGHVINNLGDYPEAVHQVAEEERVPLIDLNAMSKPFYEALGVEGSKKAFVDNTHHNNYGSYELARCIVEGIKKEKLGLAKFLDPTLKPFDPAHPDPLAEFRVPPSPQTSSTVPDGS